MKERRGRKEGGRERVDRERRRRKGKSGQREEKEEGKEWIERGEGGRKREDDTAQKQSSSRISGT